MREIPIKKRFNDGSKFLQQIIYIQKNGCDGLKCKNCCLQNICTHEPSKAKTIALRTLVESYKKASAFKNKLKSRDIKNL